MPGDACNDSHIDLYGSHRISDLCRNHCRWECLHGVCMVVTLAFPYILHTPHVNTNWLFCPLCCRTFGSTSYTWSCQSCDNNMYNKNWYDYKNLPKTPGCISFLASPFKCHLYCILLLCILNSATTLFHFGFDRRRKNDWHDRFWWD